MSKNIIGKFIYNPTVNDTKEANTQIPTKTTNVFITIEQPKLIRNIRV